MKRFLKKVILLKVFSLVFGVIFILANYRGEANSQLLLSEVAPCQVKNSSQIDSGDFIELFVLEGINLGQYKLWERDKVILTFPSPLQIPSSTILLIHVNGDQNLPKAANETLLNDSNQNGCLDFYSQEANLTATDNIIFLTTPKDVLVDFLSYANQDGKYTADTTWYQKAITSSQWSGNLLEESSFDSSKLSVNSSIGRSNKLEDSNSKNDWFLCDIITPGKLNPAKIEESILLNEVSPNQEQDWIEIYNNARKDLLLDYLVLKEKDKIIKIISNLSFKQDSFLVVRLNSLLHDEKEFDLNQDNLWEFYSPSPGITNTDSVITLEDGLGNIIDALIYSNYDGVLSKDQREAAIRVAKKGKWPVENIEFLKEGDFVYWNGKADYSLSREQVGQNFKDNWSWSFDPTIGKTNQVDKNSFISNFKIENNPFFIDEAYPLKKEAKIFFTLSQKALVSLMIYNVEGVMIKEILKSESFLAKDYTYLWDGRNKENKFVPIGIYVVYLEIKSDYKQDLKVGTIVVAKKL
ncbi:hypothetical protein KKB84_03335 [bacterium]|nr:hypothetical protein [bacterium]